MKREYFFNRVLRRTLWEERGTDWCAVLPCSHIEPSPGYWTMQWSYGHKVTLNFCSNKVKSGYNLAFHHSNSQVLRSPLFNGEPKPKSQTDLLSAQTLTYSEGHSGHTILWAATICNEALHSDRSMNWPILEINMEVSSTVDSERLC